MAIIMPDSNRATAFSSLVGSGPRKPSSGIDPGPGVVTTLIGQTVQFAPTPGPISPHIGFKSHNLISGPSLLGSGVREQSLLGVEPNTPIFLSGVLPPGFGSSMTINSPTASPAQPPSLLGPGVGPRLIVPPPVSSGPQHKPLSASSIPSLLSPELLSSTTSNKIGLTSSPTSVQSQTVSASASKVTADESYEDPAVRATSLLGDGPGSKKKDEKGEKKKKKKLKKLRISVAKARPKLEPIKPQLIGDPRRIWLGNLPSKITEFAVLQLVRPFGDLADFHFPVHKAGEQQGATIGYCFITFKEPKDASKALVKLDGLSVRGNLIVVRPAKPTRDEVSSALRASEEAARLRIVAESKRNEARLAAILAAKAESDDDDGEDDDEDDDDDDDSGTDSEDDEDEAEDGDDTEMHQEDESLCLLPYSLGVGQSTSNKAVGAKRKPVDGQTASETYEHGTKRGKKEKRVKKTDDEEDVEVTVEDNIAVDEEELVAEIASTKRRISDESDCFTSLTTMALLGLAPSSVGGAKSALCGQLARLPCIDLYGKLGRTNPHDAKKSANAASPIKPPETEDERHRRQMNAQTAIRRIEAALRRLEGKPVEEDLLGLVPMGRQIGIGRGISAGLGGSRRGDCRGRALSRATSSGRSNFAIGRRDSSNRGSGFNNYGKGAGPSIGVVTHSYGRGNYGRIDGDTNSSSLFEVSGNRATNSFNPGRICTSLGRPETGTLLSGARRSGTLPGCSRHTDSSLKRK